MSRDHNVRSALAKRMQNSSIFCSSSAKSTVDHTHALSLPLCSCSFVPGITVRVFFWGWDMCVCVCVHTSLVAAMHTPSTTTHHNTQPITTHTYVVGANLERLLLAHEQANLLVVLVLQQSCLPHPTLLPLPCISIKAIQLAFAVWG